LTHPTLPGYILIKLEVMEEPSGTKWVRLDTFEDSFE
jgi:hypothetical protein